jgi:homoserine kinase
MARKFKTADYRAMLKQTMSIEECLPQSHLARFVVEVISQLDRSKLMSCALQDFGLRASESSLLSAS